MIECQGMCDCFSYDENTGEYYKNNKYSCSNDCTLKECYNYKVCRISRPTYDIDEFCDFCDCTFSGKLTFKEIEECPICLENDTEGVKYLNCDHYICISCFRKCFFNCEPDDKTFLMKQILYSYEDLYYKETEEILYDLGLDPDEIDDYEFLDEYGIIRELNIYIHVYNRQIYKFTHRLSKCIYCRK